MRNLVYLLGFVVLITNTLDLASTAVAFTLQGLVETNPMYQILGVSSFLIWKTILPFCYVLTTTICASVIHKSYFTNGVCLSYFLLSLIYTICTINNLVLICHV